MKSFLSNVIVFIALFYGTVAAQEKSFIVLVYYKLLKENTLFY